MAGILEEGPIRKILKGEKILRSPEQPIGRAQLLANLYYFMEQYVDYSRGQIEANIHFIAERFAGLFNLSSDELESLKRHTIEHLRR